MMQAQKKPMGAAGTYYLEGVMETASGFKLNEDKTFQFFFTYGALDRYGTGIWSATHDSLIVLNSKPYPGSDFKMTGQVKDAQKQITIRLDEKNPVIFSLTYCRIIGKGTGSEIRFSKEGTATFPMQPVDTIQLYSELCGERISGFAVAADANNFTFRIQPWITEVFFKDFILKQTEHGLEGGHPLLQKPVCFYRKE
jgi:hypothetical protein